ncbi:MAG: biotin/lipoyl-binding protein [Alphaproteobacteria bacterium]
MLEKSLILPALRNDIQLNDAPTEPDGTPTWTLYDPAANKYYKIGWLEFECLMRFKKYESVDELIESIKKDTTLNPDEETINELIEFLITHNLVYATANESVHHFEDRRKMTEQVWWKKAVHSYLFFIIPLFKPEKFLKATYPFIRPLLTKPFMAGVFLLLTYGIFLSVQRFDEIANTFLNYLSLEGVILFVGATVIVKIIHELGHAYTATKYDVPVTTIGIAFIVLYPILYTETTNAWKLKNRQHRLLIAASGMMAELALSSVTLILWHFLPPGMLQSLCFMVAIVSMLSSLLVNLNPLMKFDGYYLFSDLIEIDNLQDRSFAFAKWRLRQFIWGWDTEKPENLSTDKQKLLTYFGFAVWVYRFFLYLGIALLVYHFFFQPLGLIFMTVELAFFIGLPIIRELKVWGENIHEILSPLRGKIALFILIVLFSLFFMPMHKTVEIPVTLHAQDYERYFPPISSKIEEIKVSQGQRVEKGDILFRLSSSDLNKNIKIVTQRLEDLKAIRASSQATVELANRRSLINTEIENTEDELQGLKKISNSLIVQARFSGTIKIIDSSLQEGQWINNRTMLTLLANDNKKILSGYIRETDVEKISDLQDGKFYADYSPFEVYDVTLKKLDQSTADTIYWVELSSINGGQSQQKKI